MKGQTKIGVERGTDITNFKRAYSTATAADLPDKLTIGLVGAMPLRYGENPNQPAKAYHLESTILRETTRIRQLKSGKGGLSATNLMDIMRALDVLKFFSAPSVAVMKHLIPSGFATHFKDDELAATYIKARDADARSAFGSVVVANVPLDKATAEAIASTYVEVVAAPEFEEDVMGIFEGKKNLRVTRVEGISKIPKFTGDYTRGLYDIKMLPTGRAVVQQPYLSSIKGAEDLITDPMVIKDGERHVVMRDPTPEETADMLTAWYVNIGARSNGIVLVKDGVTAAVGSGQQERVGAVEQAIVKAFQKAMDREGMKYDSLRGIAGSESLPVNPLEGAVMSSDAFFPFRDSIDIAASVGVKAIIQPGGSIRDYEVIGAVNEHGMAMAYTLERCFGHF